MGLLSIFQRNKQAAAKPGSVGKGGRGGKPPARQAPLANTQNAPDTADAVREARARARRRLMGATVLLLVGVIGFPLLFETQPRPVPVDLPIEIPARNAPGAADATSHSHATRSVASLVTGGPPVASAPMPESVSYDARSASAVMPAPAPAARSSAVASGSTAGASPASVARAVLAETHAKPAASTVAVVAAASRPVPHAAASAPAPASRPSPAILLAGATPADAATSPGRFVVQVGAFTEDAKVREARGKVEKIGLKTYTQEVQTPAGKRVRVRVGPFATQAEADKAVARIKAIGLQPGVLAL